VIPDISLWERQANSKGLDTEDDSRELLGGVVLPFPFDRRQSTEATRLKEDAKGVH
jgi:hypothetical protein